VQALNSSGKGEWSEVAILTTGTPKPPSDLTLLSSSAASLQLAWTGDPSIRSRHCSYTLEMNRADSADGKPLDSGNPQSWRIDSVVRAEKAHRVEQHETKAHRVEQHETKAHRVEQHETKAHRVEQHETKAHRVEQHETKAHWNANTVNAHILLIRRAWRGLGGGILRPVTDFHSQGTQARGVIPLPGLCRECIWQGWIRANCPIFNNGRGWR